MSEKPGMRDAINRVAARIHQDNQRRGKETTFEEARKVATRCGVSYDSRNPVKPRSPKGDQ
jgi:hypothetical protein